MANRLAHIPATAPIYSWVVDNGRWNGVPTMNPKAFQRKFKPGKYIALQFMGDLFYQLGLWHYHIFETIQNNPQTTFICLTKYIKKAQYFINNYAEELPNLWLGVSIENQKTAEERIPILINTGYVGKKILSIEPMLEPVLVLVAGRIADLDWVIVGGESGSKARPMNPDWARKIRDKCKRAGVPFWFKQMSGREEIPDDLNIQERP
jgi:protein gp37